MKTKITATEIRHVACGARLGVLDSVEDHGSFEMVCPKCRAWIEVFLAGLNDPGAVGGETRGVSYRERVLR